MVDKISYGTIHQWKKSPTPGFGLGYLIRGVIEKPHELFHTEFGQHDPARARSSRFRSATGYVIAHNGKQITTQTATYILGEPFEEPVPYDPEDFDEEKGLTQWEATANQLIY